MVPKAEGGFRGRRTTCYDAVHHACVHSTAMQAAAALPAGLTQRARAGAICNSLEKKSKIPDLTQTITG
jgi:hypothetical protein